MEFGSPQYEGFGFKKRMVLKVSKVTKFCPFCRLHKVSETMKLVKNANKKGHPKIPSTHDISINTIRMCL